MVQIVEEDAPFGRVGGSLGKAFGEIAGGELGRYRTAKGLESLSQQFKSGGMPDQLSILSGLSRIPGIKPEMIPLYQQAIQNALYLKGMDITPEGAKYSFGTQMPFPAESSGSVPPETQMYRQPSQGAVTESTTPEAGVTSEEEQAILTKPRIVLSEEERNARARELRNKNPYLYGQNWEAAKEAVDRNVAAENEKLANQQAIIRERQTQEGIARDEFGKRLGTKLQTENLSKAYAELPGTIQTKFQNLTDSYIRQGKTPAQAADAAADEALNFARSYNKFMSMPDKALLFRETDELNKTLGDFREKFEKIGALPEYVSSLKAKGYGDHGAAMLAYPASPGIRKELAKIKPKKMKRVVTGMLGEALYEETARDMLGEVKYEKMDPKDQQKIFENIGNALTENDSLNAIALALNDVYLDERAFYDAIQKMKDDGKKLSAHQELELQNKLPVEPTMVELFQSAVPGLQKTKHGFMDSILRKIGSLR